MVLVKQNQQASQSSVITRKSQRPLSVRKEIGRSRGENLMIPLTPRLYEASDEEDFAPPSDSGVGSETSVSFLHSQIFFLSFLR